MHLPPASFSSSTSSLSWTAPPPPPPMPVPVPYLASTYAAPSSLPPPLPAADRFMGSTAALPLYSGVLEASHGGMMAAPQHQSGPQVDAATFSAPPPGAFVLVPLISTAVPPALAGIFASSAAPAGMDAPPTSHHNIMTAPTVFPLPSSASSHAITGWPLSGSRMPPPFGADPPHTQTPMPYHRITTDGAVVKKKPLVIPPPAPGDLEEGPRQLIVNYIAVDMNPDELRALFEAFGPVDVARTVPEPGTGHNKGFGFVYFRHSRDAAAAIDGLSGRVLRGKRLRVSYAVPQRPLAPQVPSFTAAPNAL